MDKEDKKRRLMAARELLRLIKLFGGTARLAAAVLGVSPTTVSHWFAASPNPVRRVGAPSDAQLRILTVVLYQQFVSCMDDLMGVIGSRWIRPAEQLLLLRLLTPGFAELSDEWQGVLKDHHENLEYDLRKYANLLREAKRPELELRQTEALLDYWGFDKDAVSPDVLRETSDDQIQEFITTLIGSDSQLGSLVDEVDEAMRVVIEGDQAKKGIIKTQGEERMSAAYAEQGGDDDRKKTKPVDPE